jgi:replication factor A1
MAGLTQGSVKMLVDGSHEKEQNFQPILQVINIKQVGATKGGTVRYRAILSDGVYYVQGMLATQLNGMVESGDLKEDGVIQLDEILRNLVAGRTLVIILRMAILHNPGQRIGAPLDLEKEIEKNPALANPVAMVPPQALYNSTNNSDVNTTTNQPPKSNNNPYAAGASNSHSQGANPYGVPSSSSPSRNPYGAATSSYQHVQAPIVRSEVVSGSSTTPIANLNIYNSRWTIKARITSKSDIRTWSNAKGEGSLFSIELLDNSGHDIRGTFFKEGVDKFYNILQVGKVYKVSGGRLKVANAQYNTCKSSFEINFDQNTEIHQDDDDGAISGVQYEFHKIANLEQVEPNSNVDLLAICKSVGDVAHIVSKKSGQEMAKCDLTLVDDSGAEITLTVWRDKATTAPQDYANQPVLAFRRARLSDYGGRSLSMGGGVEINPASPEAQALLQWWQGAGRNTATTTLSKVGSYGKMATFAERKGIAAIKDENLGHQNIDKGDYITFKGNVAFIKKDREGGAWYPACANAGEPCKNRYKVTQTTDQQWQCDKCHLTYPNCVRRWIFSGKVEDGTGSTWVSFFNEQAEELFAGATADQAYAKTHQDGAFDQDAYDSYFCDALFSDYVFKCRVKNELVNDEQRVKTSVVQMWPINYVQESKDLLQAISAF